MKQGSHQQNTRYNEYYLEALFQDPVLGQCRGRNVVFLALLLMVEHHSRIVAGTSCFRAAGGILVSPAAGETQGSTPSGGIPL